MAATAVFRTEADPPAGPQAAGRFFRPELDVLRFFAFFLVFVSHLIPDVSRSGIVGAIREGGSFGVQLFFALSAYLITELLFREKSATGTIHFKAFYLRRILRIWPLYFLALLITVVLSHVLQGARPVSAPELASYLLLSGNWYAAFHGVLPLGFGVLWSIGVEEQFYLFWPTLVRVASRTRVLIACGIVWVASQAFVAWAAWRAIPVNSGWYNTLTQMQYFAIGASISVFLRGRAPRLNGALRALLIASGLLLFIVLHRDREVTAWLPYLAAGVGTTLIFLGFLGVRLPKWSAGIRYLGKISYGLYVFHDAVVGFVVFAAVHYLHRKHGLFAIDVLCAMPLTILIAHLSYRHFERPFLKLKERFEVVKSRPA